MKSFQCIGTANICAAIQIGIRKQKGRNAKWHCIR